MAWRTELPDGAVTIGGQLMHRQAFTLIRVIDQLLPSAEADAPNVVTPDVEGETPMTILRRGVDIALPMAIRGRWDENDDEVDLPGSETIEANRAPWWRQLVRNWLWLNTNVLGPFDDDVSTRTLEWDLGDGLVLTDDVQVKRLTAGQSLLGRDSVTGLLTPIMMASLRIRIPEGYLAVSGS